MKRFVFWIALVNIIFFLKIPESYANFWAEDGAFYATAQKESLWNSLAETSSGYLIFVSAVIANIVTLFPQDFASLANTLIVSVFVGLLTFRAFENLRLLLKSRVLRLLGALTLIMLPINNFENLASGTALHFQLLFVTLLISINTWCGEEVPFIDHLILVIACLSDPFAFIALIPFFAIKLKEFRKFSVKDAKDKMLLIITSSLLIQLGFVVSGYMSGVGRDLNLNSIEKVGYLYLDRVLGSSTIPNWGTVSSEDVIEGATGGKLVIRACISILVFLSILMLFLLQVKLNHCEGEGLRIKCIYWLFFLPLLYWVICGFLFNPEPRYALFPGCCYVLAILMMSEIRLSRTKVNQKLTSNLAIMVICLTWGYSFEPSNRRIEGPSWRAQYSNIVIQCELETYRQFFIRIRPVDDDWKIRFECKNGALRPN